MGYKKILLILFLLVCLAEITSATTFDLGCPATISTSTVSIYQGGTYPQFAMRYNSTAACTVDEVGFYRTSIAGTGGTYSLTLVNDNEGSPGNTVLASNSSFTTGTSAGFLRVVLDTGVSLSANTPYWVIINGTSATSTNNLRILAFNRNTADKSYPLDYERWQTKGWNGTAWVNALVSTNPVYGIIWTYNDSNVNPQGQFAYGEDTRSVWGIYIEGTHITNAPNVAYNISSISAMIDPTLSYGSLNFTVTDSAKNVIGTRSITPVDNGFVKTAYTLSSPIEVPAGNREIYAYFSSPDSPDANNCYKVRAVKYYDADHTYANTDRYSATSTGTIYSQPANDAELNLTVNYEITYSYPENGVIAWKGYDWTLKTGLLSPNNNWWNNTSENCWVDDQDRLHLKIHYNNDTSRWECTQLNNEYDFRYGTYTWTTDSPIDELDDNVTLGLYTFQDNEHELDIEITKWTWPNNNRLWYSKQPVPPNTNRRDFPMTLTGNKSTHVIEWKPTYVKYSSYQEDGSEIANWTYDNASGVPQDPENLRINLWLVGALAPKNGQDAEVILSDFTFVGDGVNYYVSPTGDDNNTGEAPDIAWKTITHANNETGSGDIINVMPGTYSNQTFVPSASNITIQAYGGYPVFDGTNTTQYGVNIIDKNNTLIKDITFKNFNSSASVEIMSFRGNNNTVENCTCLDGYDGMRFRDGNYNTISNSTVDRMMEHGVHIFCQEVRDGTFRTGNKIIGNTISNCGHNMIDVHSNSTYPLIRGNEIYFNTSWPTDLKDDFGILLHNGNVPYAVIENNYIHDVGRPVGFTNVHDAIFRNNIIKDGLTWKGGLSTIQIGAEDGSVPCDPYGCVNITFQNNTFDDIHYPWMLYSDGAIPVSFNNLTFLENTYTGNITKTLRFYTPDVDRDIVFKDENFTNFTLAWDNGSTIEDGNVEFRSTSTHIEDDVGDTDSVGATYVSMGIDNDVSDVWYGEAISGPTAGFSASPTSGYNSSVVQFTDSSTGDGTLSYSWDFNNDGSIDSVLQNPTYTYSTVGIYSVNLTVTSVYGSNSKLETNYINISPNPNPDPANWVYWWLKSHWRW